MRLLLLLPTPNPTPSPRLGRLGLPWRLGLPLLLLPPWPSVGSAAAAAAVEGGPAAGAAGATVAAVAPDLLRAGLLVTGMAGCGGDGDWVGLGVGVSGVGWVVVV